MTIGQRLKADGIVWHDCQGCGLPWPFPKGTEQPEREWLCHRCVQALWAKLKRQEA